MVGKRGALEACPNGRLQIKPSGSGDENGSNPDDDDGVKNKQMRGHFRNKLKFLCFRYRR